MSVKINVDMKEEYMVDFMLRHTYRSFAGIAGLVIGVGAAMLAFSVLAKGDYQAAFPQLLIAFLFLFVTPRNTIKRAQQQVQKSEMFQNTLEYEFSEEGVTVRQNGVESLTEWGEFHKAIETQKSVILYVTRLRAIIFPKPCMVNEYPAVVKMIREHMPAAKVKIRG